MNKTELTYSAQEEYDAQASHIDLVKTLESMIEHCQNETYVHIFENCLKLVKEGY